MHEPGAGVVIKQIRDLDEPLIAHINAQIPGYELRIEPARAFVRNPANLLLLAIRESTVLGVLYGHLLERFHDGQIEFLIYAIDVHADYHRHGIGRQLVEAAKRWAREAGAVEAWVGTERSNLAAMGLYHATGAREDPPDAVVLVYDLSPDRDAPHPPRETPSRVDKRVVPPDRNSPPVA